MKFKKLTAVLSSILLMSTIFVGCSQPTATTEAPATPAVQEEAAAPEAAPEAKPENEKLVVGFAQIGQESGWRDAETWSILNTAEELGVDLKFSDGQQKQENQIKAIRTFIQQEVDVIGVAPVVETGWETVFKEAKDAGIPIVLVDRRAAVPEDLYAGFIGSDFILEGQNAAKEMAALLENKGNIVELQGTVGASAATDRMTGFTDELKNYSDMKILASQTGDFTRAKGKEVMEAFLKAYPGEINGVYAHNDDMALGAIEAIKDAGLKPSVDIKVVSIDGVKGIFEAMAAGEANVTIECNPLLGPQFFKAAQELKDGKTIEKWVKSEEGIFRQETAKDDLPNRKY
jgi:simple sugar transport system substrate-binding protein